MKFFPWGLPRRILSYEKIVKAGSKAEGKPEISFPEVPGEVFRRGRQGTFRRRYFAGDFGGWPGLINFADR